MENWEERGKSETKNKEGLKEKKRKMQKRRKREIVTKGHMETSEGGRTRTRLNKGKQEKGEGR